jgi:hypothetical protein
MELDDFYPFVDGQPVTAAQWNFLFGLIASGEFIVGGTALGDELANMSGRLTVLEQEVAYLKQLKSKQSKREQFVLTAGQTLVDLQNPPILDSEVISIEGVFMSKTGLPVGFVGDYSINGATITINPELTSNIEGGEIMVVVYQYEVNGYA